MIYGMRINLIFLQKINTLIRTRMSVLLFAVNKRAIRRQQISTSQSTNTLAE